MNRVVAAKDGLSVLIGLDERIQAAVKRNKPIPGFRFFECPDCENKWKEKTRDCHSPSCETCECGTDCYPIGWSEVRDLPVDKSGNLI